MGDKGVRDLARSTNATVLCCYVKLARGGEGRFLAGLRKEFPRLTLQLVSLPVSNAKVIEAIANQTLRAKRNRSLLADKPELDLLLRLAGTSQISEAIARAGYDRGGKKVLVGFGERREIARLTSRLSQKDIGRRVGKRKELLQKERELIELSALLGTRRT